MALIPMRGCIRNALHQLSLLRPLAQCRYRNVATLRWKDSTLTNGLSKYKILACSFHKQPHLSSKHDKKEVPFVPAKDKDIILIDENGSSKTMTKSAGHRVARDKELRLVLVDENSQPHPTYKLMTGSDLQKERVRLREMKKSEKKKEPKTIRVTSRITQHDLETKTSHIKGWLEKGFDVKMCVKIRNDNDQKGAVDVFKFVSGETKDIAHVNQAKNSTTELVYNLKPLPETSSREKEPPELYKNEELKAVKASSEET